MGFHLFFTCFGTFIFLAIMNFSIAADIISLAQSIRDGETLVSATESFELGFFTPEKSNNWYLGIWYKHSPGTIVWVANKRNPITDKQGVLVMSDDGNLVLHSNNNSIIWFTNSSKLPKNPVAQLLDSGNLVLWDKSSDIYVWQSFDYPSDSLLTGMKLGWNLKTGFKRYLTSWASDDDSSPRKFSFRLQNKELPQLFIAIGSKVKHRSGPFDGLSFDGIPMYNKLVVKPMIVRIQEDEKYYMYKPVNNRFIT